MSLFLRLLSIFAKMFAAADMLIIATARLRDFRHMMLRLPFITRCRLSSSFTLRFRHDFR